MGGGTKLSSRQLACWSISIIYACVFIGTPAFAESSIQEAETLVKKLSAPKIIDPKEIDFEMTTGVQPRFLNSIFKRGLLNRYQVQHSGASVYPDALRIKVESSLIGQSLHPSMGALLPKYGIVRIKKARGLAPLDKERKHVSFYGPVHLVLSKDSLLNRTTFSNGDSLLAMIARLQNRSENSKNQMPFTGLLPLGKKGLLYKVLSQYQKSFIELQFWGAIEPQDIVEVWTWLKPGEPGYAQTKRFASKLGVPLFFAEESELSHSLFIPASIARQRTVSSCARNLKT